MCVAVIFVEQLVQGLTNLDVDMHIGTFTISYYIIGQNVASD